MAASEMHEMEKAALNDPLLADALEGYRAASPATTAQHLTEIKTQIAAIKTETKPTPVIPIQTRKARWWQGLSAAVLIGLMVLAGWLFMKPAVKEGQLPIAQNATPPAPLTTEQVPVKPDSAVQVAAITEKLPKLVTSKKTGIQKHTAPAAVPPATLALPNPEPLADHTLAAAPLKKPAIGDTREIASLQPSENPVLAMRRNYSYSDNSTLLTGAPRQFFSGKILDLKGRPIPGASIMVSEHNATLSNTDGSFRLPAPDSIGNVKITAVGFDSKAEQLIAGKVINVRLDESQNALNDVVVIGYGTQKKRSATGALANVKVDTLSYKESPYPQGGWDLFYNNLATKMGVNNATANRELHLLFDVDEGIPKNFTIIKTPDTATAEKAISIIQKGPRWKVFKRKKKVDLKLKVD
ncbi:hypothetical protein NIASO_05490 [Niabella soli DSM 19437]|uniref:TonB C-terminal domain-containing protein n=2 Tax=Niabella TaxID=379899 RepID=W0F777_9BACT|nr:hypothetical protein NIASO_05490 [Niabella soli DSM 19437]